MGKELGNFTLMSDRVRCAGGTIALMADNHFSFFARKKTPVFCVGGEKTAHKKESHKRQRRSCSQNS